MQDIYIRKIPDKTINYLDRKIKRLNANKKNKKKITRNQYIKMLLNQEKDSENEKFQQTKFELVLQHDIQLREVEIELMKNIILCFATGDVTDAINYVEILNGQEKKDNGKSFR